jgi:hypothetical protein
MSVGAEWSRSASSSVLSSSRAIRGWLLWSTSPASRSRAGPVVVTRSRASS